MLGGPERLDWFTAQRLVVIKLYTNAVVADSLLEAWLDLMARYARSDLSPAFMDWNGGVFIRWEDPSVVLFSFFFFPVFSEFE